jgi:hypothetical protein
MKTTKLFLLFLAILALSCAAQAQSTYTTLSCSYADVNAAINNTTPGTSGSPQHQAVNGDKIVIGSTGSPCTWTQSITINGVGIDITGTGTPNTGAGTQGAGTSNVTIIDNENSDEASLGLFLFTNLTTSSSLASVELLNISGAGAGNPVNNQGFASTMQFTGTCTTSGCPFFRVDNITFVTDTFGTGNSTVLANAYVMVSNMFGVIDHISSNEAAGPGVGTGETPCLVDVNFPGWQGIGQFGDNSFASPDTMGTNQQVILENNSLNGVRGTDSDAGTQNAQGNTGGGRWTCRFNTFTNLSSTGACASHGTAWTGRPRGVRQNETYYNSIAQYPNGNTQESYVNAQSGTGRYLSNTFTSTDGGLSYFLTIDIPRLDGRTGTPWDECDGTQPWDGNWTSTSVCLDQPGYGAGALYTSNSPPTLNSAPTVACTTAGQCPTNPVSDPMYEAGDKITLGGGPSSPVIGIQADGTQNRVLLNRDVFAEVSMSAQTSSTSPFNGSTGTGYGTLALRPTCSGGCTTGVGYWATDTGTWNTYNSQQGTLYVWNGSSWVVNYVPYTYPSPLTVSGPTMTASLSTIPAYHSGHIAITVTGNSTSWTGGTTFSITSLTGVTLVSQSITGQVGTLTITTGSTTGSFTISDSTDSATAAVSVAIPSFTISPTTGSVSCSPSLTFTGTNTVWANADQSSSGLFTVSGGTGSSLGTITVSSNTSASATLTCGSASGTLTLTDSSNGDSGTDTTSFTITGSPTEPTVTTGNPAGSVTATTATVNNNSYVCTGSCAAVSSVGVAYGTASNPTNCSSSGTASPWSVPLTGLTANTIYYYRACATNSVGTAYGSTLTFTTTHCGSSNVAVIGGTYTSCGTAYSDLGNGGPVTVTYSPYVGNGIELFLTFCTNNTCANLTTPVGTVTISDNVNNPETCFTQSPHSDYTWNNTAVPDAGYMFAYYCPSIPAGVTSFTATMSNSLNATTLAMIEWQAGTIASSNYFESVDQAGGSGNTAVSSASLSTSAPTTHPNDLITGMMVLCGGTISIFPGAGMTSLIANPASDPGWMAEAYAATSTGVQTITSTWTYTGSTYANCALGAGAPNDTWYGIIVPLVGSGQAPATAPAAAFFGILNPGPMRGQTPIPLLITASARH